jgi:fermentation-respiration switch protein FrsA (DUF1100 family)
LRALALLAVAVLLAAACTTPSQRWQPEPGSAGSGHTMRDCHAHLIERPDVDPDRVGVLGVSLGAAFALDAAAADERVRAVATLSAFSGWRAIAGDVLPVLGPMLMPPGLDPAASAARLGDRPLLIMHGDRDEIIPLRHAARIAAAAESAGVPVTLWTHPQGDHNTFVQTVPEARDRLADFFRLYLEP